MRFSTDKFGKFTDSVRIVGSTVIIESRDVVVENHVSVSQILKECVKIVTEVYDGTLILIVIVLRIYVPVHYVAFNDYLRLDSVKDTEFIMPPGQFFKIVHCPVL